MVQLTFFDTDAQIRRDDGIYRAIRHADIEHERWSNNAYAYLKLFIQLKSFPFLAEDLRFHAEKNGFPIPPSKRAWGAVVLKAKRDGLIKACGYKQTTNPKAHCTPACLWVRN